MADHDVFQRTHGSKRTHHRLVGALILGHEAFRPVDDADQVLGISTVEPGSPSAGTLAAAGVAHPAHGYWC